MSLNILIAWIMNIAFDAAGQLAFKSGALSENHHHGIRYILGILGNRWILLGIGCYFVEFFLWLGLLSLVPLSDGVLLGSFNIVAVFLGGRYFLNEKVTKYKVVGVTLVTLGVILIGANM